MRGGKVLAMLFLPAVLNFIVSGIIAGLTVRQAYSKGLSPEEIGVEVMAALFTYSFYWLVLHICFGLPAIKLVRGWEVVKEYYRESGLRR